MVAISLSGKRDPEQQGKTQEINKSVTGGPDQRNRKLVLTSPDWFSRKNYFIVLRALIGGKSTER